MNRAEMMIVGEVLGGTFRKPWPPLRCSAWLEALDDLPGDEVVKAAREWAKNREEEPKSPSALRAAMMVGRGNQREATPSASRPMDAEELAHMLAKAERDVAEWEAQPPRPWLPSTRKGAVQKPCGCPFSPKCPPIVQLAQQMCPEYRCMYQAAWTKLTAAPHMNLPEIFFDLVNVRPGTEKAPARGDARPFEHAFRKDVDG